MTTGRRACLTVLSLILSLLSLPGGPLPQLVLVSLVPLGLAIHGASPLEACAFCYLCALGGWLGSTNGIVVALSAYLHLSRAQAICVLLVLCAYSSLPYGVFGLFYGAGQWMNGKVGAVKTAACLALLISVFPSLFPVDSSHALYCFPVLVQILSVGGQPLLLFILYFYNWLFVELILCHRNGRSLKLALASILAITVLIPAYGYLCLTRSHNEEAHAAFDRRIRIGVIQPNTPLHGDSDPHSGDSLSPFHALLEMSDNLLSRDPSVDLVIWPETPTRISCNDDYGTRLELRAIATQFRVPFLVNCVRPSPNGGDYNTELFLTPNGHVAAYDKQMLLPFAEYIPAERRFAFLRSYLPHASRYEPGNQITVFPVRSYFNVFPAVCYEMLFPRYVRRFIEHTGNVLVSPSNDAWFGPSRIPDFVMAEAVYQAIEYRIPVIRVSNSGNSIAVAASGETLPGSRLPAFSRQAAAFGMFVPSGRSLYFRVGDSFLWILAVAVLLLICRGLGK